MPFEEVFPSAQQKQQNIGTAFKNESLPKKVHPVDNSDFRKVYANTNVQQSHSSDSTLIDDDRSVEGPPRALKTVLKFNLPKSRKEKGMFPKKLEVDNLKKYWKLEEYGGVKIWVNSKTGEVSVENPESDDEDEELCSHTSAKQCGPFLVHREGGGISNGPKSGKVADNNKCNKHHSKKSFSLLRVFGFAKKEEEYHSNDVKEWFDLLDSGRTSRKIDKVVTSQKRHHGQAKFKV